MRIKNFIRLFITLAVGSTLLTLTQSVSAQPYGGNYSPDPYGLYGLCNSSNSAIRSKALHVYEVGENLTDVLGVTVLNCSTFSGGGGTFKVSCPEGSPYAYCTRNQNDGGGNDIALGVLKMDSTTDANGLYTGCPDGAQLQSKLRLVQLANREPRLIKGIVTLDCRPTRQTNQAKPKPVHCPPGPNPYSLCLRTPNDGFGNAVTIGIVATRDQGDAYGLYGECEVNFAGYGMQPGFNPKSYLVTAAGRSMEKVRTIDILGCGVPWGMNLSAGLQADSCSTAPVNSAQGMRYDYCIWGTDDKGNGVVAGVNND